MKIDFIKILYLKELRSGRMVDYSVLSFISMITLYSGVHIFIPMLTILLLSRFIYPLWDREEERLLYSVIGYKRLKDVLWIKKMIFMIECNVIFILFGLILKGFDIGLDIINYNSYLFLFLFVSDYLFNINIGYKSSYKKWIQISVLLFTGIIFSLALLFLGQAINPWIIGSICLVLVFVANFFSSAYIIKHTDAQNYFYI